MERHLIPIAIVGGGIGGLSLALCLHRAGMTCRIYEATSELKPLGVGINIRPHAMRVLGSLGLAPAMLGAGNEPQTAAFYARSGQRIFSQPLSRAAGYAWPHVSIHRADLHALLRAAVNERLGEDALVLGHELSGFSEEPGRVRLAFRDRRSGSALPPVFAGILVGCDGIGSAVRQALYPDEGPPRYSGITMWRGVTRHAPILDGRTNCRIGALQTGKLVIYPIRNHPDGTQLVNWVVEVPMQAGHRHGWASPGRLEDFAARFARWRFDWLDIPALLEQAQMILEYPMVDRDPLPRWSFGRVSLLGDAAHPMVPRGGNGAAQAILDAQALAGHLSGTADPVGALRAYEAERLPRTTAVVNASRTEPPDTLISRVEALTGGRPFERIEAVIDPAELAGIADRYALTAGYDLASANQPATLPGAEPPGVLPRPARR